MIPSAQRAAQLILLRRLGEGNNCPGKTRPGWGNGLRFVCYVPGQFIGFPRLLGVSVPGAVAMPASPVLGG